MFCRNCGEELSEGIKYCPNCGTKVENGTLKDQSKKIQDNLVSPLRQEASPEQEIGIEYREKKDERRNENYIFANRIGTVIAVAYGAIIVLYKGDSHFELIEYFFMVLPFIVELFCPFPYEWGIVRKVWTWFWHSVVRLIVYELIAIIVGVIVLTIQRFM